MKKRVFCLMAMMMVLSTVMAQRLIPINRYGSDWKTESVSTKNKPNGYIYRLREEVRRPDLPKVPETEGLFLFISEPIDIGWMGLFRLPLAADDYKFVVVIYDFDLKPLHVLNLCDITSNSYCEVQDVRWDADNHHLLFNMACPSYSSMINGKGSKLYCYSVGDNRLVWETDYLVSNDIFILNDKYVFCSYGFTSENKYLFMLDKLTGKVYSKLPMVYKVEYMELQEKNGRELLYVVDYNNNLYTYAIGGQSTTTKTGSSAQKPKAFTVVYATSDDGFLNVRAGASTKSKILTKLYGQMHGLGSGVLLEKGNTWSKISVDGVTGWVYNKYLGSQNWYDGKGKTVMIANRDKMPIYGENYVGEGEDPVFTTVPKGTIIADQYDEHEDYYVLKTGHDYLFIKKNDVKIEKR